MQLLTKQIRKQLPPLYSTEAVALEEKIAVCKFFTPDANWTWYACEFDPADEIFFGYVIGLEPEWGYFSLKELTEVRGFLGLPVERDLSFVPQPIKHYLVDAW